MSLSGYDSDAPVESGRSAISWGPIIAGAVAALGITIVLLTLGSGVGLTMVSPWSGQSASAVTVGYTAAIWFVVVQWLSFALGGYLTGRLRTKWTAVHTHEVYFRDTAHGFVMWALATVISVGFLASSLASLAGAGASAIGTAVQSAGVAGAAVASKADTSGPDLSTSYFTDALLRPDAAKGQPASDSAATGEVSRILLNAAAQGQMSGDDKNYLTAAVASKAGIPQDQAKARVDAVVKQIDDAKTAAKVAADKARKTAATTALLGSIALLIGAFIASAAAAFGGSQRDEEEDLLAVRR